MPEVPAATRTERLLAAIQSGDRVRVRHHRGSPEYEGEVDVIGRRQRILWIITGPLVQRILIDTSEYAVLHHAPARLGARPEATVS